MKWYIYCGWCDGQGQPIYDPLYAPIAFGVNVREIVHTAMFQFVESFEKGGTRCGLDKPTAANSIQAS